MPGVKSEVGAEADVVRWRQAKLEPLSLVACKPSTVAEAGTAELLRTSSPLSPRSLRSRTVPAPPVRPACAGAVGIRKF